MWDENHLSGDLPASGLLEKARQFSELAFEFRRMSAQIDNAPFPVVEDETFGTWEEDDSEDEDESEDVDEETTSLASALGAQAECLDYIAERVLSVAFSDNQTDELVGIHLSRLVSILEETIASVLDEATQIKDNLEKTVQTFCEGMTLEDSEAVDGIYEMAIEAFEGETDRMEKVKEIVDRAIDDLQDALEGAEDGEIE